MTLQLKPIMASARIKQEALADAAGISRPALSGLINHGALPRRYDRASVEACITKHLRLHGVANADDWKRPIAVPPQDKPEETLAMLLRKVNLTPQAKRHFNLAGNPFADPTTAEDVFLSQDIRYVRETMYQVARNGGFMAVIGESGAGKSTLREELQDRIRREEQSVLVIEPYVLGMEGSDTIGKTLRAQHIAEAIMATVDPQAKTKSSPEARFRQVHETLRNSSRAGQSHVLVIEEAHSLPLATLKHLKRFRELKDGLRPLLSIILIGQPELAIKLSEHNPEVREVVQRIEIVTLPPLGPHLGDYLAHRFKRIGMPVDKVLASGALEALRTRLAGPRGDVSLLYPLAVHNALAAAMNRAADLGVPLVNADLVKGG
ncbi:ExeA family protein [Thermomonas sp.]|uniref:ExeA family protein n=1 Tax=Thermomonas sp. TaxID=1971895 RepID=UPI0035B41AAC